MDVEKIKEHLEQAIKDRNEGIEKFKSLSGLLDIYLEAGIKMAKLNGYVQGYADALVAADIAVPNVPADNVIPLNPELPKD